MKLVTWNVNSLKVRMPRVLLADRLTACGIDRDFRKGTKPSDHTPLLVELD